MKSKVASAVILIAALIWAFPINAASQTVTVTTVNDVVDFGGFQQVRDLPGPDGQVSFREACIAANNTPGPQTIAFAIPESEWWLMPGIALLRLENGAFPLTDDGTVVDFTTQAAFNGGKVGIFGLDPNGLGAQAISIDGNNCVIKGLDIVRQRGYAARIMGNNNRVISCNTTGPLYSAFYVSGFIGFPTPTGNIIGGTQPGEGNVLSSVGIDGPAEGTVVIGNQIKAGVYVRGATQYGLIANNTRIGGTTSAELNVISGAGSLSEEGLPVGAQVTIVDADNTLVEGNFIGTTTDGMAPFVPQIGPTGVEVRDARSTIIRNNLIAGLRSEGVNHFAGQIFGQAVHVGSVNTNTQDTLIQGNTIGVGADGTTPVRTRSGILVSSLTSLYHALNTVIAANHIASVETNGVFVAPLENGVKITTNSIHDNGALGIDLSALGDADGPTLNDPGDIDTGANGLQNFPLITLASQASSTSTLIQGSFNSAPNQSFTLEFFSNSACDPTGFGEGQEFLGSTSVNTDGNGDASFLVTLPIGVRVGDSVTGTATDANNNTSEFSQCRTVSSGGVLPSPTPTPTPSITPSPTPTPTPTPPPSPTPTPAPTITPPPSPTPTPTVSQILRSTNIALSARMKRSLVTVTATISVRDGAGKAASGATVSGTWTLPDGSTQARSATTNSTGNATFSISSGRGTYALTETNITKAGYAFDQANSVLTGSITK